MRNLDRDLTVLRDTLRDSVHQPELDAVVTRSRQRISRRRRQLGAAVAVLLIAAAVPLLRTPLDRQPDTPATPPPTSPTDLPDGSVPQIPDGPVVGDIDFADDRHGYAFHYTCDKATCTSRLLATEDGTHWQARSLPPEAEQDASRLSPLRVLGPRQIILGDIGGELRQDRWYSGDGGHTWQAVPSTIEQSVAAIPDGGVLDSVCPALGSVPGCRDSTLVATLPESGRMAKLASQPALELMFPDRVPAAADGSWWVTGLIPGSGRWGVAVSRDAGRTWSVVPLPDHQGDPLASVQVTVGPDAVYAAGVGRLPGTDLGLIAIFRSTDGGRSWTQTWRAADDTEPRSLGGVAVAASDGRLIVHTTAGVPYASGDGGVSFAQAGPSSFQTRWTRAGYLSVRPQSTECQLSRDGLNWTRINFG